MADCCTTAVPSPVSVRDLLVTLQVQEGTKNILQNLSRSTALYSGSQESRQARLTLQPNQTYQGGPEDLIVIFTDQPLTLNLTFTESTGSPAPITTLTVNQMFLLDMSVVTFSIVNPGTVAAQVLVTLGKDLTKLPLTSIS